MLQRSFVEHEDNAGVINQTGPAGPKVPFLLQLAMAACVAATAFGATLLPIVVGSLAEHGFNSRTLGALGFVEFGCSAAGAFLCAAMMKRFRALPICCTGACLMMAGNLISAYSMADLNLLFAGRAIAGMGNGLVYAGIIAEMARVGVGTDSYGLLMATVAALSACGYLAGPWLAGIAEGRGIFFFFAAFGGVALALVLAIARYPLREVAIEEAEAEEAAIAPSHPRTGHFIAIAMATIAYFAYAIGETSLFTFTVPLGQSYGHSFDAISHVMVLALALSVVASLMAGFVEKSLGLIIGIVVVVATMIVCNLMLVLHVFDWAFMVFILLRIAMQSLVIPLLLGLFAGSDPTGRAVAASVGGSNTGLTVAPLAAGYIVDIEHAQYVPLGLFSSAAWIICMCIAWAIWRRTRAHAIMHAKAAEQL